MSDDWNNDDDYNGDSNSGGSLRAQLEKVLKENQALKTETASLKGQITARNAADVLADKGFKNPAFVGKSAIADGVDFADEEAVTKWITENGDNFAKAESIPQSQESDESDSNENPAPPEGAVETFGALDRVHSAASAAAVNLYQARLSQIPDNATPEQVREALAGL